VASQVNRHDEIERTAAGLRNELAGVLALEGEAIERLVTTFNYQNLVRAMVALETALALSSTPQRFCEQCGKPIEGRPAKRFCGGACAQRAWNAAK
jgi:hypothetical protein